MDPKIMYSDFLNTFLHVLNIIHELEPYPDNECIEYQTIEALLQELQDKMNQNKRKKS